MITGQPRYIQCLFFLILFSCGTAGEELSVSRGMVIRESGTIRSGTYLIPGIESEDGVVMTILGRDITLDFQGAVIQGASDQGSGNPQTGIGICLDQASNVTIKNLTLKGYRVGLQCKSCEGLVLDHVDLDGNTFPQEYTKLP